MKNTPFSEGEPYPPFGRQLVGVTFSHCLKLSVFGFLIVMLLKVLEYLKYLKIRSPLMFYLHSTTCINKLFISTLKQLTSRIYLKIISYKYFKISLQIYILKRDNSLFCHRDIPTIHNGYCISNAVDYAKKNDVLPTILSTELRGQYNRFLH